MLEQIENGMLFKRQKVDGNLREASATLDQRH